MNDIVSIKSFEEQALKDELGDLKFENTTLVDENKKLSNDLLLKDNKIKDLESQIFSLREQFCNVLPKEDIGSQLNTIRSELLVLETRINNWKSTRGIY